MSQLQAASLMARHIAALTNHDRPPPFVGLNGAQGAGKSTIARLVTDELAAHHGIHGIVLALDDFYLSKSVRLELARSIHPLCATRGVPGTHDTALLSHILDRLVAAQDRTRTPIPRFDKLADDLVAQEQWPVFEGRPDFILLEGWCVGIERGDLSAWSGPMNTLEAGHDPDGKWHAWSRAALADYEPIWSRMNGLISVEVPGWQSVIESRLEQERGLEDETGRRGMARARIEQFVAHYERITRAGWIAMRRRADQLWHRDGAFRYRLMAQRAPR